MKHCTTGREHVLLYDSVALLNTMSQKKKTKKKKKHPNMSHINMDTDTRVTTVALHINSLIFTVSIMLCAQ